MRCSWVLNTVSFQPWECPVLYKSLTSGLWAPLSPRCGRKLCWGVGPPPCPKQDEGLGLETSPGGEACPNLAVCSLGRQRACLCWWAACSFCSPREIGVLSAFPGRDLVAPLGNPSGSQPWNLMRASSPRGWPLAPGNTCASAYRQILGGMSLLPPPGPLTFPGGAVRSF